MKIAYFGFLLGEGLRKLGHELCRLPLRRGADLESEIAAHCPDADLVLLELFGGNFPFTDLTRCKHRLALYCIDSTINEFWLEHITKLADDVFVDQRASVASLARAGVKACWLPLCVPESSFREERPLEHGISFVGTVDSHRVKRMNILRCIEEHFPLNRQSQVSSSRMLDIFAASKISINENLFSGLTLRMLQSMAAGTILFTEADNPDVDELFEDGKELVCYGPDTLIPRLKDVLDTYPDYRHIARAGQAVCRLRHSSEVRAGELLRHMDRDSARNTRHCDSERRFHSACGEYLFGVRFGGFIGNARKILHDIVGAGEAGPLAGQAALMLGDVYARLQHPRDACAMYRFSVEHGGGVMPLLKTAMVQAGEKELALALQSLKQALAAVAEQAAKLPGESHDTRPSATPAGQAQSLPDKLGSAVSAVLNDGENPPDGPTVLFLVSRILFEMGKVSRLGFIAPGADSVPDFALPLALRAWELRETPELLDFIIICAKQAKVGIELLPTLISAIHSLCAEKRHIFYAAEVAYKSYDKKLAETLLANVRKKTAPPGSMA